MAYADYYRILEIPPNASSDDIKKAYRKRALKLHPDVNKHPEADAQFKALNEARDVLSDPTQRMQYDRIYFARVHRLSQSGTYARSSSGTYRRVSNPTGEGPSLGNWWEYDVPTNGTGGFPKYDPDDVQYKQAANTDVHDVTEEEFSKYVLYTAVGLIFLAFVVGRLELLLAAAGAGIFWLIIQLTTSTGEQKIDIAAVLGDPKRLVQLIIGVGVLVLGVGFLLWNVLNLSGGPSFFGMIILVLAMYIVYSQVKKAVG